MSGAQQSSVRKHMYLIVDAPDEDIVGNVETVDKRYDQCKKNEQRPVHRRDIETNETWTEQLVALGYYDFESEEAYEDSERFVEVVQQKLSEVDEEHLRAAGLEPDEVTPDE